MSDLISRQAAIDAAALSAAEWDGMYVQDINGRIREALEKLPSAQSEPIKINIDDFNKEDLERFKKELGNTPITVLPAQPEIIRCKDCKYRDENWRRVSVKWLPCMDVRTGSNWYCGSAERRTDG